MTSEDLMNRVVNNMNPDPNLWLSFGEYCILTMREEELTGVLKDAITSPPPLDLPEKGPLSWIDRAKLKHDRLCTNINTACMNILS